VQSPYILCVPYLFLKIHLFHLLEGTAHRLALPTCENRAATDIRLLVDVTTGSGLEQRSTILCWNFRTNP